MSEVKPKLLKALVRNNNMAKISYCCAGVLYYHVSDANGNLYQFEVNMNDKNDIGLATFPAEIKAITLMRYIRKSMENDSFVSLNFPQ